MRKIVETRVTHDCASILDSIAKGISLFPRFFAWCIPTSIFIQLNDFYTCENFLSRPLMLWQLLQSQPWDHTAKGRGGGQPLWGRPPDYNEDTTHLSIDI